MKTIETHDTPVTQVSGTKKKRIRRSNPPICSHCGQVKPPEAKLEALLERRKKTAARRARRAEEAQQKAQLDAAAAKEALVRFSEDQDLLDEGETDNEFPSQLPQF
jgi:hypothetical protein